jgi:pilus assembly protein Flp/PilA
MSTLVLRFVKDESGATAIEYGLIAAGIAVAIIANRAGARDELEHHVQYRFHRAQVRADNTC